MASYWLCEHITADTISLSPIAVGCFTFLCIALAFSCFHWSWTGDSLLRKSYSTCLSCLPYRHAFSIYGNGTQMYISVSIALWVTWAWIVLCVLKRSVFTASKFCAWFRHYNNSKMETIKKKMNGLKSQLEEATQGAEQAEAKLKNAEERATSVSTQANTVWICFGVMFFWIASPSSWFLPKTKLTSRWCDRAVRSGSLRKDDSLYCNRMALVHD